MRRMVYVLGGLVLSQAAMALSTIENLHTKLRQGTLSCTDFIRARIERIQQYDLDTSRGAPLNAIVHINPQAIEEARRLDSYIKKHKKLLGSLHCVPVALKDNINSEQMPISNGSLAMLGSQPNEDAMLVTQLRNAGAIILATTSMDEFASGMFGISSRSGRNGNAYNPRKNAGGSSGGAAVAVASDFALVGIGSDNSGSVRIPAGFNGLYGLRPGMYTISAQGLFPRGYLDGVAGPITKTPQDMRIVLRALSPQSHIPRLKGHYRIGMVTSVQKTNFDLVPYQQFFKQLKSLNIELVPITLTNFNSDRSLNRTGEVEAINQYLAAFPSTRRNFADICQSKRTEIFGNEQECLDFNQKNPGKDSPDAQKAQTVFADNQRYVLAEMKKFSLDALLIPMNHSAQASYDAQKMIIVHYPIASNSGLPGMSIPFDYHPNQLPLSIELIGKPQQEHQLIDIAEYWSNAFAQPVSPSFKTSNHDLRAIGISAFNNLKTQLGWIAYRQYLQGKPDANINAQQMSGLVKKVLEGQRTPIIPITKPSNPPAASEPAPKKEAPEEQETPMKPAPKVASR